MYAYDVLKIASQLLDIFTWYKTLTINSDGTGRFFTFILLLFISFIAALLIAVKSNKSLKKAGKKFPGLIALLIFLGSFAIIGGVLYALFISNTNFGR